jgi:glycine betaine/proline transport system permease protein
VTTRHRGALVLVALAGLLALAHGVLPAMLMRPPEWLVWPFADWLNAVFSFCQNDLGLMAVTRFAASGIEFLLDVTGNLFFGKNRWPHLAPLPWTTFAITAGCVAYALAGWRLALFSAGTFVWIAVMGQWEWAMQTLSVVLIAAPVTFLLGLGLGILAWRAPIVERVLNPLLNIAQSLPQFAYMIPVVVFVGVGPKAGAITTIVFALPPMIRMTVLGLKKVPENVVESGLMSGATPWQMLTRVRLPTARNDVLIGVNQVIMQCLAMVVLTSFIGMPGLGQKLLQLMQSLKIGLSFEIGVTIVLIAVTMDRISRAWAVQSPRHFARGTPWHRRHRILLIWAGLMVVAFVLASLNPWFSQIARADALSVAKPIDAAVDILIRLIDPASQWLRWFLITWILIPFRDGLLWLPFTTVLCLLMAVGFAVGGTRSALVCLGYFGLIAMTGWWDRAMITVYTVTVSVALAALMGFPLGIWGARRQGRAARVLLACDTLQTFPSFIYLIPVIMLFGVNDVAVVGAVVLFAAVPLVRYTIEGLRGVSPELVEAAAMAGADRRQLLWKVQLPVALPTIMVGVNQSVMFSLFMVIIAAFIGTQDLGQEMQRALSTSDVGKGLVLGLAVAFMGLSVDHLVNRWSAARTRILGLNDASST